MAASPDGGQHADPLCVLVVDDYPDAADTLAALVRLWRHQVQVARDGPSALAAVQAQEPDVILLDILLPGLDGYALAKRLCAVMKKRPWLVAISGCGQEQDRRRCQAEGFDHFFMKPADPDLLRNTLNRLTSQTDRLRHDPAPPGSEGGGPSGQSGAVDGLPGPV